MTDQDKDRSLSMYCNFIVLAVSGRMAEADFLMRMNRDDISHWSLFFANQMRPAAVPLYRGLLLEPEVLQCGKLHHQQERTFLSFTEDLDVALWFAHPETIIGGLVMMKFPRSLGYVAETYTDQCVVLFHYQWAALIMEPLVRIAQIHPQVPADQFLWNLRTQREVIVAPKAILAPRPLDRFEVPPVDRLEHRFCPPDVLANTKAVAAVYAEAYAEAEKAEKAN